MDSRLTEVLVCPVCKGPLTMNKDNSELCCPRCRLAFAIRGGIAVMLENEARQMTEQEAEKARPSKIES